MKAQKKQEIQAQAQICNDLIAKVLEVFSVRTGGIIRAIHVTNTQKGNYVRQDVQCDFAIPEG